MESRDERANPFKKNITGAIGPNPFKKMREMREKIESRNEREDGEQRREREKGTDKMREMRDRGKRVEIKYFFFLYNTATVQF